MKRVVRQQDSIALKFRPNEGDEGKYKVDRANCGLDDANKRLASCTGHDEASAPTVVSREADVADVDESASAPSPAWGATAL